MTADLVARLGFVIEDRAGVRVLAWSSGGCRPATEPERAMWDALRSSGEAVAWAQVEEGEVVGLAFKRSTAGDCIEPLYLHPATVTDEDVERAMEQYLTCMHNRAKNMDAMRAALESFVRKQPAASAALERV